MLKFSDGINVDTRGSLRRLELKDGLYVVGEGMLIPMKTEKEVEDYLAAAKAEKDAKIEERVKTIKNSPNPQKEFFNQIRDILK